MTERNEFRWVKYPVIIGGAQHWRYGLFDVHFINDAPAHAELPQIVGYSLGMTPENHPYVNIRFSYAFRCETLVCTNAVDLDNADWDGSLIFDHLPVLA